MKNAARENFSIPPDLPAERQGFEPWVRCNPYNRLAICHFRPLSHLSEQSGAGARIQRKQRGRDSNPRNSSQVQRFSRPPVSTTHPPLQAPRARRDSAPRARCTPQQGVTNSGGGRHSRRHGGSEVEPGDRFRDAARLVLALDLHRHLTHQLQRARDLLHLLELRTAAKAGIHLDRRGKAHLVEAVVHRQLDPGVGRRAPLDLP